MSIGTILVAAIVVLGALFLFNRFAPESPGQPNLKRLVNWVVLGIFALWLFKGLGGCAYLDKVRI